MEQLSGQPKYPIIQFEDGSVYREESKEMAATIKAGKLFEKQGERNRPPDRPHLISAPAPFSMISVSRREAPRSQGRALPASAAGRSGAP